MEQAKMAVRGFGEEADITSKKTIALVNQNNSLLRGFLQLRGTMAVAGDMMKHLGLETEQSKKIQEGMTLALDAAILALGIYRGAQLAASAAALIRAHAEALASVMSSPWFLIPVALGVAVAAWAAINALSAPHAQFGAVIPPRAGGVPVIAGEAGQTEVILPLDRLKDMGFGGGGGVNVTMHIYSDDPREIARQLGREVQKLKLAGA